MSTVTTPVTTLAAASGLDTLRTEITKVQSTVKTDANKAESWLKVHERIILALIISLALLLGSFKYLGVVADRDKQQANIAAQTLAVQHDKDVALAQQAQQDATSYKATVAALSQQNAQLVAASASRTIVLQQQQATDKTLPMPNLGNRWASLIGAQPGDLTATTAGITVTPQAALDTTLSLEQVPVLKANLADAQTQITNGQAELAKANTVITDQAQQIDGLGTELTDQKTADAKELTAVKAQARKGKLHAFLYGLGVGAGAVTGLVVHALL
jgi:choline-glycine betaine transporter